MEATESSNTTEATNELPEIRRPKIKSLCNSYNYNIRSRASLRSHKNFMYASYPFKKVEPKQKLWSSNGLTGEIDRSSKKEMEYDFDVLKFEEESIKDADEIIKLFGGEQLGVAPASPKTDSSNDFKEEDKLVLNNSNENDFVDGFEVPDFFKDFFGTDSEKQTSTDF